MQYVTIMVGWGGSAGLNNIPGSGVVKPGFGRILTFALDAHAKLVVPPFGYPGSPSASIHMNATPAMIRQGEILYSQQCFYCHGVGVVSSSGVPDLRYASAATHHQFESIVLGRRVPTDGDALVQRRAQTRSGAGDRSLHTIPRSRTAIGFVIVCACVDSRFLRT